MSKKSICSFIKNYKTSLSNQNNLSNSSNLSKSSNLRNLTKNSSTNLTKNNALKKNNTLKKNFVINNTGANVIIKSYLKMINEIKSALYNYNISYIKKYCEINQLNELYGLKNMFKVAKNIVTYYYENFIKHTIFSFTDTDYYLEKKYYIPLGYIYNFLRDIYKLIILKDNREKNNFKNIDIYITMIYIIDNYSDPKRTHLNENNIRNPGKSIIYFINNEEYTKCINFIKSKSENSINEIKKHKHYLDILENLYEFKKNKFSEKSNL